jgi:hypothetical protein
VTVIATVLGVMRYGNATKVVWLHRANPLAFLASLARAVRFNPSPVVRPRCSRPIVFAPRTPRTPSGVGGHSGSSEFSLAMLLGMDLFSVAFVPLFGVKLRNLHPPSLKIMAWRKMAG